MAVGRDARGRFTSAGGGASVGHISASIGLDQRQLAVGAAQAQATVAGMAAGMTRSLGAAAAAAGPLVAALAGIASVGGLVLVTKQIADLGATFSTSITRAGAVMRATAEEQTRLVASAREMGSVTEWTASQAAESLAFLGMAGFSAEKAMAALPGTLDLATAGGIDLGRAADIATNALTAMKLPVEQLTRVNDTFVGTITRSNVTMEMMAESFKYAAPMGAALGYEVEELSSMIGKLGDAGIQGSSAGTQLAEAMRKAATYAAEMGLESGDLLDVLDHLNRAGTGALEMFDIFGVRGGKAALVLRDVTDETREFQDTLRSAEGEAARLADTIRNTLTGRMDELKSTVEALQLEIFDTFEDRLKAMVEGLTKWLRDNREAIVSTMSGLVSFILGLTKVMGNFVNATLDMVRNITRVFEGMRTEADVTIRELARITDDAFAYTSQAMLDQWKEVLLAQDVMLTDWGKTWRVAGEIALGMLKWFEFVATTVFLGIAALIRFVYGDMLSNLANVWAAARDVGTGIQYLLLAPVTGAKGWVAFAKQAKLATDSVTHALDSAQDPQAPKKFTEGITAAWDKLKSGINWEGIYAPTEAQYKKQTAVIEKHFEESSKRLEELAEKRQKMLDDIEEARSKGKPPDPETVETVQAVSREYIDLQTRLYGMLLQDERKTMEERLALWQSYADARRQQIGLEGEDMKKIGASADEVRLHTENAMQSVDDMYDALFSGAVRTNEEMQALVDTTVSLYSQLLNVADLDESMRMMAMQGYIEARTKQIEALRDAWLELGVAVELVDAMVDVMIGDMQRLGDETEDEFDRMKVMMSNWAYDVRNVISNNLFDALKGDVVTLRNFIEDVFHAMLRQISNMTADIVVNFLFGEGGGGGSSVMDWIMKGIGKIGGLFGGGGGGGDAGVVDDWIGFETASQGLYVGRKTALIAGEAGPEVVVPLSHYRQMDSGGSGVVVHMNVQTPDAQSFRRSERAILGELSRRMAMATGRD